MSKPKVAIGFITYGAATSKYLPEFIKSVQEQNRQDFAVLVVDNSWPADKVNDDYVRQNLPAAELERSAKNLGFAKAANQLLERAKASGADYFFLVNPDTYLDQAVVRKLVDFMDNNLAIAAASPKILRWDFARQAKTDIIDSCGLALRPGFKFIDLGQGERDSGQCDQAAILGPSGASAFFRLSALDGIKFDEHFFMYKEDCDLAYQLFLAGKQAALVPEAIVYHDRTVAKSCRRAKSRQARQWSFYGQHLLLKKYWRYQTLWSKLRIVIREIGILGYVLVFERYLLKELKKLIFNF